jgi:hypothetical protein
MRDVRAFFRRVEVQTGLIIAAAIALLLIGVATTGSYASCRSLAERFSVWSMPAAPHMSSRSRGLRPAACGRTAPPRCCSASPRAKIISCAHSA